MFACFAVYPHKQIIALSLSIPSSIICHNNIGMSTSMVVCYYCRSKLTQTWLLKITQVLLMLPSVQLSLSISSFIFKMSCDYIGPTRKIQNTLSNFRVSRLATLILSITLIQCFHMTYIYRVWKLRHLWQLYFCLPWLVWVLTFPCFQQTFLPVFLLHLPELLSGC